MRRGVLRRPSTRATTRVLEQLQHIEKAGGDGVVEFERGRSLHVSNLAKVYFPESGLTKGGLMQYYARMSHVLLPVIADRPLVLKRYPDGVGGGSFYQQSPGDATPEGVRVELLSVGGEKRAPRLVGGDLLTLLYTVQLGAIAVHSWQSRVGSIHEADSSTIDLDPGKDVPFAEVVRLARLVRGALDELGLRAGVKTSGSSGLHIVMPLPPKVTHASAARLAQLVAKRVTDGHPELATLQRRIQSRPPGTIYLDWQQNAEGKSVVAAYSVRARPAATVSAPLSWRELRSSLRLSAFTVETMAARIRRKGDLWAEVTKCRNTRVAIGRVQRDA
jgi:bifunctional non-homologous end joining protein LigD